MSNREFVYAAEVIRSQRCHPDLWVRFPVPLTAQTWADFVVYWSHIHQAYIGEYYSNPPGSVLVVDELTRAHILAYFEDTFYIQKVAGVLTEDRMAAQARYMQLFTPKQVPQKPTR